MAEIGKRQARLRSAIGLRFWFLVALASMPVWAAAFHWLDAQPLLVGDIALLDLRVKDVNSLHLPLVGFYSRFGWNHPGPVLFYLLAPFRLLSGGATWGLLLGTLVGSLASIVVVALLARRRGGFALVALCLAVQLAVWLSVGGRAVVEPWTPEIAVTWLIPFLLAMWGVAEGDAVAAIAGTFLGTVLVQVHVGYASIVLVLALVAIVLSRSAGGFSRKAKVSCACILAVLWAPVAIDAVVHGGGNVRHIAGFFRSDRAPGPGFVSGLRVMSSEVRPLPGWLAGRSHAAGFAESPREASVVWVVALLVIVVSLALAARRRADRSTAALASLAAAGLVVGAIAAGQTRGTSFNYVVLWRSGLAAFAALSVCVGTWRLFPASARFRWRTAVQIVSVGLVAAGAIAGTAAATTMDQLSPGERVDQGLVSQTVGLAPKRGDTLLRLADTSYIGARGALFRALEQSGKRPRVERHGAYMFGSWRTTDLKDAQALWYVSEDPTITALLERQPGATILAEVSPLDERELARMHDLSRSISEQLRRAGRKDLIRGLSDPLAGYGRVNVPGVDVHALNELVSFNVRIPNDGYGAVIAFPPGQPPRPWWPGPTDAS